MRYRSIIHDSIYKRGFTLLLAAIIASIAIALGAAIFDIAQKQIILSSSARESQFAFYAADTGAECALYWDLRCQYFATTTPSSCSDPTISFPPTCDTKPLTISTTYTLTSPAQYPYSETFQFDYDGNPNNYCTQVTVSKTSSNGSVGTSVVSNGYNVSCSAIDSSTMALERSVKLSY